MDEKPSSGDVVIEHVMLQHFQLEANSTRANGQTISSQCSELSIEKERSVFPVAPRAMWCLGFSHIMATFQKSCLCYLVVYAMG